MVDYSDIGKFQSLKIYNGKNFEKFVYGYINSGIKVQLESKHISLLYGGNIISERPDVYGLLECYTSTGSFIGDVDILLYDEYTHKPLLIISTKTSVRERFYQVAYTYMLYKQKYPNILLWFVTEDSSKTGSEFGTDLNPRQARKVAAYHNIPIYSTNPCTSYSGNVKPFNTLNTDIIRVFCK
jgi:hypothetical protein